MDTAAHTAIGNPSHNSLAGWSRYSDTVCDTNRHVKEAVQSERLQLAAVVLLGRRLLL
jgi:hypothetical protein